MCTGMMGIQVKVPIHLWIGSIIFGLIQCSFGQPCPESMKTLVEVSRCPTNKLEWDTAATEKNCENLATKQSCSDPSNFVYHCLLNEWANGTVEVCAPTWFISGFCAMFSSDEQRIKDNFDLDCSSYAKPCDTRYISSEAYKYPSCYEQAKKLQTTSSDVWGQKHPWVILGTSLGGVVLLSCIVLLVTWRTYYKREGRRKGYETPADQGIAEIECKNVAQKELEEGNSVQKQTTEYHVQDTRMKASNESKKADDTTKKNIYVPGYGPPLTDTLI